MVPSIPLEAVASEAFQDRPFQGNQVGTDTFPWDFERTFLDTGVVVHKAYASEDTFEAETLAVAVIEFEPSVSRLQTCSEQP